MSVSECCPPLPAWLPNACSCSGVWTKARLSDPISRKLAGAPGSVFGAVLSLTRGIEATFWSMKAFTPTMPPRTMGRVTANATANRPSTTRAGERGALTSRAG
jgi:hypothetical protein